MALSPLHSIIIGLFALFVGWTLWSFSLDARWEPTEWDTVNKILNLADLKPGEVLYDLGCGDGRIVVTGAKKYGADARGIEINPLLFLVSKLRARIYGASDKVEIKLANMYDVDLRDADVIVLFLSENSNSKLSPLLKEELKPGARIVSYYHLLPDWEPMETETSKDGYNIFLYKKLPG